MSDRRASVEAGVAHERRESAPVWEKPEEILVVEIGNERMGFLASHIQEILPAVAVAPLRNGAPFVEGVFNLRGDIVPVFDMRRRLGLEEKAPEHDDHLVVATTGACLLAFHVDRAAEIVSVEALAMSGASGLLPDPETVIGFAALPEGALVVRDPARLMPVPVAAPAERKPAPECG